MPSSLSLYQSLSYAPPHPVSYLGLSFNTISDAAPPLLPPPPAAARGTAPSWMPSRPLPSPTLRPTPRRPSRPARACRTAVPPPSAEQYKPAGQKPARCALAPACLVTAKRLQPPPEAAGVAELLLRAEAAAVAVRVADVEQLAVAVHPRLCRGRCCGPALIPSSRRS